MHIRVPGTYTMVFPEAREHRDAMDAVLAHCEAMRALGADVPAPGVWQTVDPRDGVVVDWKVGMACDGSLWAVRLPVSDSNNNGGKR